MQKSNVYDYISDGTPKDIQKRYALLNEVAKNSDFGYLDKNIVVLDTETTGFSYHHDELTQIAAARMKHGEITEWFVTFVNPGKPIPDDVARLTNIYDSDVADALTPFEAITDLIAFVGDSPIIAHNAAFDKHFTADKHAVGAPLCNNLWIDSLDLARIALPRLKSHRLIDLVHAFDAPISTHRADADVEALCSIYRILLAAIVTMPVELVRQIAELADPREWPTGVVFSYIADYQAALLEAEANETSIRHKIYPFSLRAMRSARFKGTDKETPERVKKNAVLKPIIGIDGELHDRPLEFPSIEEIQNAFTSEGLVGGLYESFEPRNEQIAMATEVLRAQSTNTNLVVEAGTGVGKSMAYLVPSTLAAVRNNITIGIATKTNALLDQIMYKELPALDKAFKTQGGISLTYTAIKGFTHYPCLYRVNRVLNNGAYTREIAGKKLSQAPSIAAMLSFIEQTEYDDIDGLKLDYRVLPRYMITCTSRDCLRRKCPFYGKYCFVHGQRMRAEQSDVVVTNHALLFCDVAADGALLPHIKHWIVDEAHGAEIEARRALAAHLDAAEVLRLIRKLESDTAKRNIFLSCQNSANFDGASQVEASTLFYTLTGQAYDAGRVFANSALEFVHHIKDLIECDTSTGNKSYETIELWINDGVRAHKEFQVLMGYAQTFIDTGEKLVRHASELVAFIDDIDSLQHSQHEVATIAVDVKEMIKNTDLIFNHPDDRYVYSAKLCRRSEHISEVLTAELIDVGSMLNATLYQDTDSVVYTSATITVGENFDAFHGAMGLNESDASRTNDCILGSSYDFDKNMMILVVDDIPEPNQPGYMAALQKLLTEAHIAQQGSMLTLFTNRREMESCFDAVNPEMKKNDLRLVCQKWGVSTKGLRDDFLKDEHLSLFALKSFWEGFDAPGATLKSVVIPKLPFAKPSDPLSCERSKRDNAAWSHYVLPAAVIDMKQAAGRLIRSSTDTGCLILADKRLITKGYGKVFLKSMPSKNVKICSTDEVVRFLKGDE